MLTALSAALVGDVKRAAELLVSKKRICILTGAGVSAESGIPTFRDKQTGLWQQYRAEDLATCTAFARDPQLVWSWYQWRRQLVSDKVPNPAHHALAQWQQHAKLHKQQLSLITQNVDDLHEQAGSTVTHLHGHLWHNRCSQCDQPYNDKSNNKPNNQSKTHNADHNTLPTQSNEQSESSNIVRNHDDKLLNCTHCGCYIRPDIVWFGESLPMQAWQTAESNAERCEVFISIGTSSLVYPAAGLAQLAKQSGAKIIEINPDPTPNTLVDITLAAKAGIVMPQLIKQVIALQP
ncbi:NAD-dependent deacetylase [Psychrobacter sp. PL15]|uniref:SIR2 family NAD-dependent protein deacylase n=1 Tax=Psychrobacter sp. PL15 TaxID=3071719 RepID=UPI002DFCB40E|nr:NAD-dependent deacetylase [Psychrobacter sp. PL15]